MQISDEQVERFCSAFYAHWDLTANDVARGKVRDAILTAFAATPEPISVQNMRQEMSLLISLFKHAIATPGYGQDPASREEAEDHIDSAGRALEAALSLPVQPVAWRERPPLPPGKSYGETPQAQLKRHVVDILIKAPDSQEYGVTADKIIATCLHALTTPPVPPTKGPEGDLLAALEVATSALEGLSYIHDGNPSDARADTPPLEYARHMLYEARQIAKEAVRKVLALRNARQRCEPVAVRKLVWMSDRQPFFADGAFCRYRISSVEDDTGAHWETTVQYRGSVYRRHDTEDEAKAEAQADYERRIRFALEPVAVKEGGE